MLFFESLVYILKFITYFLGGLFIVYMVVRVGVHAFLSAWYDYYKK
jgi:hypothetical protein